MKKSLTVLLSVAAGALGLREPTDRPNVVMFFVDDLGYGDLGFTGHPTTKSPTFDKLAKNGKILSTWYSGCPVCSGSRSALMTGRQFVRLGVPGVFGPTVNDGLNLNETIVAKQLKKAGYKTAMMGKWHLGQREVYLPGSRGFDRYLGIPYSDDMGKAKATPCKGESLLEQLGSGSWKESFEGYVQTGDERAKLDSLSTDPGGEYLPLVYQKDGNTTVLEQPLDFSTLGQKYSDFVTEAIEDFQNDPFLLYMPFSHVHTTASNQPEMQYAGCNFKNVTERGMFGDALAESDWIASNVISKIESLGLQNNTLIVFSSDNGPWMSRGKSGGSTGIFYGRASGYWNVGKGSTWEGGIREPAFAYWPGQITAGSRSSEMVSSLDFFPTVSKLAGVPLPEGVYFDGKDMSDILLNDTAVSSHEVLFFYPYGSNPCGGKGPTAARYGKYKAHFASGPGIFGCTGCDKICYDPILLFDVEEDPSEAYPLAVNTTSGTYADVISKILAAKKRENETMYFGELIKAPDQPGEGPNKYGVCCDRSKNCDCNGAPSK
eukprot:TRINITY_DN33525_c0_g1_i1.p1 TRINITY_DN33525_c0_g1~~TRINITY_DN33525_c0_g1_i1.p1  ORF type:complete len:558 (+),score=114.15 TRINITY_DN33525_c0_g1_i1:38-1675(+)